MAISRPLLLALLGAVLLGATFAATMNARNAREATAVVAVPGEPAEVPSTPPSTGVQTPEQTIQAAFSTSALDSAAFEANLLLRTDPGSGSVKLSGAFDKNAGTVALNVNGRGTNESFDGGFVSTGKQAFLVQDGTGYQLPAEALAGVKEALAQRGAAQGAAQPLALKPAGWLKDAKSKGYETIDGVETTHVVAQVDAGAMVRDVLAAVRQSGGLPAGAALPPEIEKTAGDAVKKAQIDVFVGKQDRLLRRLAADVVIAAPRVPRTELTFELELSGVNEKQEIQAPANVRRGLPSGQFGTFAEGLVAGITSAGGERPVSVAALSTNNPKRAQRAVAANRKVVIFFKNPRGLDDQAVAQAVGSLERNSNALVLSDHVDAADGYGQVVQDLGVSQTPSIVIIDRTGEARLIEGFIDSGALVQAVADAR